MDSVLAETAFAPEAFESVAPHDPAACAVGVDSTCVARKIGERDDVRPPRVGELQVRALETAAIDPERAIAVGVDLDELFATVDDAKAVKVHTDDVGAGVGR
jgi:hypothetical protein